MFAVVVNIFSVGPLEEQVKHHRVVLGQLRFVARTKNIFFSEVTRYVSDEILINMENFCIVACADSNIDRFFRLGRSRVVRSVIIQKDSLRSKGS